LLRSFGHDFVRAPVEVAANRSVETLVIAVTDGEAQWLRDTKDFDGRRQPRFPRR
jgi:hypothetical protein